MVLVGATTENPFFEVNAPLVSRATLWRLEPLSDRRHGRRWSAGAWPPRAPRPTTRRVAACVAATDGDARAALTTLEVAVALARPGDRGRRPPGDPGRRDRGPGTGGCYHQGADDHYDQVERADQEHPGLGPRRRALLAGPDARGRRGRPLPRPAPGILASEDVGMADPRGLLVADAAARAVELVGPARGRAQPGPRRRVPGHGAQVEPGHGGARAGPRRRPGGAAGEVPAHLRDAHYRGAATIGHGEGYRYPHDDPRAGWTSSTGPRTWRATSTTNPRSTARSATSTAAGPAPDEEPDGRTAPLARGAGAGRAGRHARPRAGRRHPGRRRRTDHRRAGGPGQDAQGGPRDRTAAGRPRTSPSTSCWPRDPAGLSAAVAAVSTPGSHQYRQYLAPGEFAARSAPTRPPWPSVRAWLDATGLSVDPTLPTAG